MNACVQGDKGTITKFGNAKIVKTTHSTHQPDGNVLNQIVFDYSIDYEILSTT